MQIVCSKKGWLAFNEIPSHNKSTYRRAWMFNEHPFVSQPPPHPTPSLLMKHNLLPLETSKERQELLLIGGRFGA